MRLSWRRDAVVLVALAAVAAVLAALRWAGPEPFGSDNDEYRLLARSLWQDGSLLVAGVEGSKYPLGYSFVLGALDRVGLPITTTALVLNGVLVLTIAVLAYLAARRLGTVAAAAAAGMVLLSGGLWDSFYAVMPDVALAALVIGAFCWLLREPGRYDVLVLCGFAAGATLLKTLGITLAAALGAALLARAGARRWAWAPPLAAVAVAGLQALAASRYPASVTGYAQTFWQVDPGDGSAGRIGPSGLPARMWEQLPEALSEPAQALVGRDLPPAVGALLLVALLAAAGAALPRWRLPLLAMWLSHTVLLSAWNFRGDRFGLPLTPLAAVGAGAVVAGLLWAARRGLRERTATALTAAAVCVALASYALVAVPKLGRAAAEDGERYGRLEAATAEFVAWADGRIPAGERIASVDYRELSYRLDRPVLPVRYDRDPELLLGDTAGAGAQWFVALRGLYGRRAGLADTVVGAYPDRFRQVWTNGTVDVYEIGSR
jgi:hypothetical protein